MSLQKIDDFTASDTVITTVDIRPLVRQLANLTQQQVTTQKRIDDINSQIQALNDAGVATPVQAVQNAQPAQNI
jgi:hypothetical protein